MATKQSEATEAEAQSPSMNQFAVKAIHEGIAEQASRQEEFQLSVRLQGSPDGEATKEFHKDLLEFIQSKVAAGDVEIPEVAVALWEEVNRMEKMVREADAETEDDATAGDDLQETNDGDSAMAELSGQPSTADGEGADSEADSGLPEDPAFH